jgi:hypothetical protein
MRIQSTVLLALQPQSRLVVMLSVPSEVDGPIEPGAPLAVSPQRVLVGPATLVDAEWQAVAAIVPAPMAATKARRDLTQATPRSVVHLARRSVGFCVNAVAVLNTRFPCGTVVAADTGALRDDTRCGGCDLCKPKATADRRCETHVSATDRVGTDESRICERHDMVTRIQRSAVPDRPKIGPCAGIVTVLARGALGRPDRGEPSW